MSETIHPYPEHQHPHEPIATKPNEERIWLCEECSHVFSDTEIREGDNKEWGHVCKCHPQRKGQRCESHLEPYTPDKKAIQSKR